VDTKDSKLEPLDPNMALSRHYPDPERREVFVRALFDKTALHYDRINHILSLGSGSWYRRRELLKTGLRPGMRVLDVATGTGLVARQAAVITGELSAVVGLDFSAGMLAQVRSRQGSTIGLVRASAERLPLADESFHLVSMGYALRHIADLNRAFREFYRVLKPGGQLLMLEISRPSSHLARVLSKVYFAQIVPWLSRWTTGSEPARTLMQYYWDTIEHCIAPESILRAIEAAGFRRARCDVELGLFRAYLGQKP
jgi:demethylmenaquinone methyltransferase/2-methoxy-6-polyprenyl-1,4-benzoquinol methylase